jgi:hypothetical protein
MIDHEPHIEKSGSNGWYGEEVHRRDSVLVILEKRQPALPLILVWWSLREIPGYGCQSQCEAELFKVGMNLPCSPTILQGETTNEPLHLLRDRRSPGTTLRDGSPIEAEALAVPANHRLRFHDDKDLLPARPEPEQSDPEGTIQRCERGPRSLLGVRRELPAQDKLDDRLFPAASEEGQRTVKRQHREVEQSPHGGRDSARSPGPQRV